MILVHYIDDDSMHVEICKIVLERGRSGSAIHNHDGIDRSMDVLDVNYAISKV